MPNSLPRIIPLFACLALAACDPAPRTDVAEATATPAGDDVIARWNDEVPILRSEYESWLAWRGMVADEASLSLFATGAVLARAARQNASEGPGPSAEMVETRVRERALGEALDEHIAAGVKVGEDEIDAVLVEHPDAFTRPRRFGLSSIHLDLAPNGASRGELETRIAGLRERVLAGEDFATLAKAESESQSRLRGGSLGLLDEDELPEPLRLALAPLQPGELTPVLELGGGLSFYRLERIVEGASPEPGEVRRRIRQRLFKHAVGKAIRADNEQLLAAEGLRIDTPEASKALLRLRADRAEALGLGQAPRQLEALRWRTMERLAQIELQRRARARLVEPDDATLRAQYEQARAKGRGIQRFRIAGIDFGPAGEASLRQAREVGAQLRRGTLEFAAAAKAHSIDPSAQQGGDLGWFDMASLGGRNWVLMRAARSMQVGEVSGVLNTEKGLWIVQLLEHQSASETPFEAVAEQLRQRHRQSELKRLQAEIRSEIVSGLVLSPGAW